MIDWIATVEKDAQSEMQDDEAAAGIEVAIRV